MQDQDSYIKLLIEIIQQAIEKGKTSDAIKATKLIGDVKGFFSKNNFSKLTLAEMTDEDLDNWITQINEEQK